VTIGNLIYSFVVVLPNWNIVSASSWRVWGKPWKSSVSIATFSTEVGTEYLENASLHCYHYLSPSVCTACEAPCNHQLISFITEISSSSFSSGGRSSGNLVFHSELFSFMSFMSQFYFWRNLFLKILRWNVNWISSTSFVLCDWLWLGYSERVLLWEIWPFLWRIFSSGEVLQCSLVECCQRLVGTPLLS
jgi:hypothetical protein